MWRSDRESKSFIAYLPGGSTMLGTWIGSLMVISVSLFHSSARADGASVKAVKPAQAARRAKGAACALRERLKRPKSFIVKLLIARYFPVCESFSPQPVACNFVSRV